MPVFLKTSRCVFLLEIKYLRKYTNLLTVLCNEKQKQEKKSKPKKNSVVPGGGLKTTVKDYLEDYGGFNGGYVHN